MLTCRLMVFALFLLSVADLRLFSQSATHDYQRAAEQFRVHTSGDFLHDDSHDGIEALKNMWRASAQAVVEAVSRKPDASIADLNTALCELPSSTGDCGEKEGASSSAVTIGPHLFLASQFSGEAGTVFIVGIRHGKPSVLWSIDNAAPQQIDSKGILGAWKAERAGGKCREQGSEQTLGICGPLYGAIGTLPADDSGRPRFYVDAGYAQIMGATVGHQTSVWRWDGDSATLLWIDLHGFMIDQKIGTVFAKGILTIGEKDEFRTFYGCGSCEARQMVRKLEVTPAGISDLGKFTTTPELDLIDELFWRLSNNSPTAEIAAPPVSRFLRPQVVSAKEESKKIDPNWISVGMLGDIAIKQRSGFEEVCFTTDDIGRLYFTIDERQAGKPRIVKVIQPHGDYGDCPK